LLTKIAKKHNELIQKIRRELHQIPELGFQEFKTTQYICDFLDKNNINYKKLDPTGALATINGELEGKTIAIRADIDALPIKEDNNLPFKSKHDGIMHACGHDAHTAVALVLAKILQENKKTLPGIVKIIFQPNEEGTPSGAPHIIKQGILENPDVDIIYGFHISTDIPHGKIGIKPGIASSYVHNFNVELISKGTHAASPHESPDPIVVAAQIITTLQTIASRFNNPLYPFVLTIGEIRGGTARNIITSKVYFNGTIRMTNPAKKEEVKNQFYDIIYGFARAFKVNVKIDYWESCPGIINDKELSKKLLNIATETFGKNCAVEIENPSLGADDFAFYLEKTKGIYFRFGVYDEEFGSIYAGHTSKFIIPDTKLYRALLTYLKLIYESN